MNNKNILLTSHSLIVFGNQIKISQIIRVIFCGFFLTMAFNLVVLRTNAQLPQNLLVSADDSVVYLPLVVSEKKDTANRKVNAPYFSDFMPPSQMAVFWFGKITPSENYADVRVGYSDSNLVIRINIVDRLLWYDAQSTSLDDLSEWDAVSLYLSTSLVPESMLSDHDYKFVGQLNNSQNREYYQAAYQGSSAGWNAITIPFNTESGWRGQALNDDQSDKGWSLKYEIPFDSLGYSQPPHDGIWRLAIEVHDRDFSESTNLDNKIWPENLDPLSPETWGGLYFGLMSFSPSVATPDGVTTISNGFQGAVVQDGHVGGAFDCGDQVNHWTQWGQMNYENIEPSQINIQNQMDISDWPCFSKYFITFPLEQIPDGSAVISATVTMKLFGNSGMGWEPPPQRSWIQVLTVSENWAETQISWNNAPLAYQNIGIISVEPLNAFPGWPGVPYTWDVSWAVDNAVKSGDPLRLALYSADSAIHSGKYFYSSNSNSDGSGRPVLQVFWQSP